VRTISFGLTYEQNVAGKVGGINERIRSLFGVGKLHGYFECASGAGAGQLRTRGELAWYPRSDRYPDGLVNDVPVLSGSAEIAYYPAWRWLGSTGVFVRLISGRDYYNAFFVDDVTQFQIGVTADSSRPLRFRGPTRR